MPREQALETSTSTSEEKLRTGPVFDSAPDQGKQQGRELDTGKVEPASIAEAVAAARNRLRQLFRWLAALLGLALGVWLSMPVGAVEERVLQVQPGDSLSRIAAELAVSEQDLIAWNQEAYPLIAERRVQIGWVLEYHLGDELPRWRVLVAPLLETKTGQQLAAWIQYSTESFGDPEKSSDRLETRYILGWINYYRREAGLPELYRDFDLDRLAEARAEIYTGVRDKPLNDYPLCEVCVEIRSRWFQTGSVGMDWQYTEKEALLGDYVTIGIGYVTRRDDPHRRPWNGASVVAIFYPSEDE